MLFDPHRRPPWAALSLLLLAPLLATPGCSDERPAPEKPPAEATYEVVSGWPSLPEGVELGESAGVAVDSHNHVFVFHRAGAEFTNDALIAKPTVLCVDGSTGALISQWGEGRFIVPHGLSIDADDNVWLTDVRLNRIFKFSHDGEPLMELGIDP